MRPEQSPIKTEEPPTQETRSREEQLAWEVQAVLAWHDEDATAAIRTLLTDCRHLREQLVLAEGLMSRGMGRGWRPAFERAADTE